MMVLAINTEVLHITSVYPLETFLGTITNTNREKETVQKTSSFSVTEDSHLEDFLTDHRPV